MKIRLRDGFVLVGLFWAGAIVGRFGGLSSGPWVWALTTAAGCILVILGWTVIDWRRVISAPAEEDHPAREITRTVRVIFETKGAGGWCRLRRGLR